MFGKANHCDCVMRASALLLYKLSLCVLCHLRCPSLSTPSMRKYSTLTVGTYSRIPTLTVGIITSFCSCEKFHNFTVTADSQYNGFASDVYASVIVFSVTYECDALDKGVMAEGVTFGLGHRLQTVSDWTVVKQCFADIHSVYIYI